MKLATCSVCEQKIPQEEPYFCISRMVQLKLNGVCLDDIVQTDPLPPLAVLTSCQKCMTKLLDEKYPFEQFLYQLFNIEIQRLYECCIALMQGNTTNPVAETCSVCASNIETSSNYMRTFLTKAVLEDDGCLD